ncbi:MAG: ATP-dependent metallopeptidase FtsH/Yme1/Tma family protein, partial [Ignavibacteriales bacterium]|nr:ATP-dependent metallopeptidase FtsH/Yme1/Tma family protein [Ignavibacteriales bacterium]
MNQDFLMEEHKQEKKQTSKPSLKFPRPKKNNQLRPPRPDDDFNWSRVVRVVLSWSAIILGVFIIMTLFRATEEQETDLNYNQYVDLLHAGKIKEATIKKTDIENYDFHGVLKAPEEFQTINGKKVTVDKIHVTLPFV